jgi:hypothetical protein
MAVTERSISYSSLRMIVMALHNQGEFMKSPGLTFSHGNLGNEYLELASYLDAFVADLEKKHIIVLKNNEELVAHNELDSNMFETLRKAQELVQLIMDELGLHQALDILPEIERLKKNEKKGGKK